MKVAMVRPPNKGNPVRGVGFYADRLFEGLSKLSDLELSWMHFTKNPFAYQKYDIVHFPYYDLFDLTFPPLRITRTIITLHDLIPLKFPKNFPLGKKAKAIWPIQKKLLTTADWLITDSQASKTDICDLTSFNCDKISAIYLAPDAKFQPEDNVEKLAKVKKRFTLPDKFVLYVGGVNWNKNLPALISAINQAGLDLILVGKEFTNEAVNLNHPELQSFKDILPEIKNNPKIHRLGFVETDDLVGIYNLASVYVLPSVYEGFGLPLLESFACGTPVICGKNSSLSEIGGGVAIYADVTKPAALSEVISKIANLPKNQKDRLKKKCLDHARLFSWQKTADATYDIYHQVLANI